MALIIYVIKIYIQYRKYHNETNEAVPDDETPPCVVKEPKPSRSFKDLFKFADAKEADLTRKREKSGESRRSRKSSDNGSQTSQISSDY